MTENILPTFAPGAPDADKRRDILQLAERVGVKFLRLQFTDILGVIKNVEVPDQQFATALDGKVMFDGSSIEGFVRIEESDMYLTPDLDTFRIFPWTLGSPRKGRPAHLRHSQPRRLRRSPGARATRSSAPSSRPPSAASR